MKYEHIPSTRIRLEDSNSRALTQVSGDGVLVIGRSYKGPNGLLFLDNTTAMARSFRTDSPLFQAAASARTEDSNVWVYRIGGKQAEITGFAGPDSVLITNESSDFVDSELFVYVGPSSFDPLWNVLIVTDTKNNVVYSNVPETEIDTGAVIVSGFDQSLVVDQIGTMENPVALNKVADYGVISTGTEVVTPTADPGVLEPSVVVVHVISGATVENFISINSVEDSGGPKEYTFDNETLTLTVPDGFVGDDITVNYSIGTTPTTAMEFTAPSSGMNATLNEVYEWVDRALGEIDLTGVTVLDVIDSKLDHPNIADGSTVLDKLSYLNIEYVDGEAVYEWSDEKSSYKMGASTTTDVLLADRDSLGRPVVAKEFSEVNFAHMVATHLNNAVESNGYVIGIIRTTSPANVTVREVTRWAGRLPTYSFDGSVVSNGTGLLGNKFMAGTTTREKGFFQTTNGFPDGTKVLDQNGFGVDIGKFLVVVPGYTNTSIEGSVVAAITNSTPVGEGTTNKQVNAVALPFTMLKQTINDLSKIKYTPLQVRGGVTRVVSGNLATANTSDYEYVSTAKIVQAIVTQVLTLRDQYIGGGINDLVLASMRNAVAEIMRQATVNGWVSSPRFNIIRTGRNTLHIPIRVAGTEELRDLDISVGLII